MKGKKGSERGVLRGRFEKNLLPEAERLNASIYWDWRLAGHDLWQNRVYSEELLRQGIIPRKYERVLKAGWSRIEREIRDGTFPYRVEAEDIHLNLEMRLTEIAGEVGKMIHTGRSRNDQVATVVRLWLRDAGDILSGEIRKLILTLQEKALTHRDLPFPGYTHLQLAEWTTFGHYLHAYAEMFLRDLQRYCDWRSRMNYLPLGSGALSGTGFYLDRDRLAKSLGFYGVTRNSLDAVSDRDFILEFLSFASLVGIHLSRFMEEFVLFSSFEFKLLHLPEEFCTGSSLLPHKYNPDIAELVRGKAGELISAFLELSMILKGLPLAYNKDLQNDKPPLFRVVDTLRLILPLVIAMVRDARVVKESLQRYEKIEGLFVPSLLDYLVFQKRVPFRKAYELLGKLVREGEKRRSSLSQLPLRIFQKIGIPDPEEVHRFLQTLSPGRVLAQKKSYGSPNPDLAYKQMQDTHQALENLPVYEPVLPWAFEIPPPAFLFR
jgi:argininosuccinate lyase